MNFTVPNKETVANKIPTLCFATMCKNEAHCIRETLESVYEHIDYWIVCDTGSTDNTCEVVTEFFKEKNIPGELFHDEWSDFGHNKTLMFERVYNKTDYLLHLDADDQLKGDFSKNMLIGNHFDKYNFKYIRGTNEFLTSSLYNNRIQWKYAGVCHNIIICLSKKDHTTSDLFVTGNIYVDNELRGSRQNDPEKYIKEAIKLQKQFFDTLYNDPDGLNNRSCFYTAQSYMDSNKNEEALQWYCLYLKLKNTWIEEVYETYLRISQILMRLNRPFEEIERQINRSIEIFPDRAEGYYMLALHCNHNKMQDKAYHLLIKALNMDYDTIKNKYLLFIRPNMYGKYIYDELSVSCFWTNRFGEGKKYLEKIIDDPDFQQHKERLIDNMQHFNNKIN